MEEEAAKQGFRAGCHLWGGGEGRGGEDTGGGVRIQSTEYRVRGANVQRGMTGPGRDRGAVEMRDSRCLMKLQGSIDLKRKGWGNGSQSFIGGVLRVSEWLSLWTMVMAGAWGMEPLQLAVVVVCGLGTLECGREEAGGGQGNRAVTMFMCPSGMLLGHRQRAWPFCTLHGQDMGWLLLEAREATQRLACRETEGEEPVVRTMEEGNGGQEEGGK